MKIKFEELQYQTDAVNSSVDLFKGQNVQNSQFTITGQTDAYGGLLIEDGIGIANNIHINRDKMLENLQKIQIKNQIAPSEQLLGDDYGFPMYNIEMETGTGKTFVYFKTILELHQKYGFLKFIIIVPSVAIKEGVLKTYETTRETFKKAYQGIIYDLFPYDSKDLNRIRTFATANTIDIMVITMDSFNKNSEAGAIKDTKGNVNVIYRQTDQLGGERAIDLIAETNPIVIIDEPQVVDNTPKSREAIQRLNPSVGFRYSATHRDTSFPTTYKLGAVESYEQELVKQIEVASVKLEEDGNEAYLNLKSIKTSKKGPEATLEVYVATKDGAVKKDITLKQRDIVSLKTKLPVYDKVGFVQDIDATPGQEYISFSGEPSVLTLKDSNVEDLNIKRAQIQRTIKAHLDKEVRLQDQGIKILSLFFLDKVANYRIYNEEGTAKGLYAQMFEEEYTKLIQKPEYADLLDRDVPVEQVHEGYFSKDKKGNFKDTGGSSQADESTYEIIMRDKEGLLTQYNPQEGKTDRAHKIRFIFSHSALKEGWDNPNVFQICTLVPTNDDIAKRQKIGRGLRIAVNQEGHRVQGFDVNTLTVIANESYKQFAEDLQKEYEKDGIVFGEFTDDIFATIILSQDPITEEIKVLGKSQSKALVKELKENGYIDRKNHATDKLRLAIKEKEIEVSSEFEGIKEEILEYASRQVKTLEIKNADERVQIKVNKEALSDDFIELWNKIKYKTTYRVNFDTDQLIDHVVHGNNLYSGANNIQVKRPSYIFEQGSLSIDYSGIEGVEESFERYDADKDTTYELPDIITFLQNETELTRKTIVKILTSVDNLDLFTVNPLSYMNQLANVINLHKRYLVFDGLQYRKLDNEYYEQSLFTDQTLEAYLKKDFMVDTSKAKTTHDFVKVDSSIEYDFAKKCELDESIKYYIKLPQTFLIRTPLGNYNPDWAILKEEKDEQRLYFIVETKGSRAEDQLRFTERMKIRSGEKHFQAIDTEITFKVTDSLEGL